MTAKLVKKPEPIASAGHLLDLAAARKLIVAAKKPEDVKQIRDQASALQAYARQRKQSLDTMNLYGEIKLRGERRLGELVKAIPKAAPGRKRRQLSFEPDPKAKSATLKEQKISKARAREWQKIAGIPDDSFEYYIDDSKKNEREITTAGALRLVGGKSVSRGGQGELFMPEEYVEAVREALGGEIDLDPASSAQANERIGATKFFDEEAHGLDHPWKGAVYLFPPRIDAVGEWIDKLLEEHRAGRVEQAVLVVDAAPERSWFQDLWRYPICFTNHKIEFLTAKGKPRQLVHGTAFVYLGAHVGRFVAAFREHGTTVQELRS